MTSTITSRAITANFQLRNLNSEYCVPEDVYKLVNKLWHEAIITNPSLFDASVLCTTGQPGIGNSMECISVPYRYLYAQRQHAELRASLLLNALAVSGLVHANDGIIFGVRETTVSQYPDCLELVPSGTIDASMVLLDGAVDYRTQILNELHEEVGIEANQVMELEPVALIFDEPAATYDICLKITLQPQATYDLSNSGSEYRELIVVEPSELTAFIARQGKRTIPTTIELLKQQGLLDYQYYP